MRLTLLSVTSGADPVSFRKGCLVEELEEEEAGPVKDSADDEAIARIPAGNDEFVGTMMVEAIDKVGPNGALSVESSPSFEATIEIKEALEESVKKLNDVEESEECEFNSHMEDMNRQLLCQPPVCEETPTFVSSSKWPTNYRDSTKECEELKSDESLQFLASSSMTREAILLAEEPGTSASMLDVPQLDRVDSEDLYRELANKGQVFIRSKRLSERRSKKRNTFRTSDDVVCGVANSKKKEKKKIGRGLDPDDTFKLFLRDRETTEFLTAKEEKYLFTQIQNLMKLEEAQQKLEAQFGREPTLAEWAQTVGMSCKALQSCIRTGKRSREKMARSNFRLVIHVARQYEKYGLDIQDLVQDGCCGLMKTFEKFNPNKGCRFPTYAYWWIRQSIKKSIYKHSRLIRLPESVFALLKKVGRARMECIMEGEQPNNVNIARRVGITIEKLARLKAKTRKPRSMQDRVWSDEGVTFQEITEDLNIEPPDLILDKLMMRCQVRDFLGILTPREKEIIKHRFGIYDGEPKTLHVIGDMYGLSKERIRQLQNRALDKLKRSASAQGLDVYMDLLT